MSVDRSMKMLLQIHFIQGHDYTNQDEKLGKENTLSCEIEGAHQ